MTASGHAVGWPIVRGGSQQISNAFASYLRSLGGVIETGAPVRLIGGAALGARRAVRYGPAPGLRKSQGADFLRGTAANLSGSPTGPGSSRWTGRFLSPFLDGYGVQPYGDAAHRRLSRRDCGLGKGCMEREDLCEPFILLAQQSLFDPRERPWASTLPGRTAMSRTDRHTT